MARHFRRNPPITDLPLLHEDIRHDFLILFIPDKLKPAQRRPYHAVDLVRIFPDLFIGSAKAILGEFDDIAGENELIESFFLSKDVLRN